MKEINIHASPSDFSKAGSFIEGKLSKNDVSRQIISESTLAFEAIFNDIIMKGFSEETQINVSVRKSFGNLVIKIAFPGQMYIPMSGESPEESVEYKIIKAYEDKLDYSYRSSFNIIHLTVKRGFRKHIAFSAAGFAAAPLIYAVMLRTLSPEIRSEILTNAIVPVESLFTNAMLMIGAPMTFFSLLKNILETYIISERSSVARRLHFKTLRTSLAAVVLAVLCSFFVRAFSPYVIGTFGKISLFGSESGLTEIVSSIVPPSVFEPFTSISPLPLIILTILISYALCSAGRYFDKLKSAIDACYTLFSRMLNLVMYFLPVFCFTAFMDILLDRGFASLRGVALCWGATVAGLIAVSALYAVRLKAAGIKVIKFTSDIKTLIKENIKINSAIDAVPYNIRQCSRRLGIDRGYLEEALPLLAQTNLDGNCFILMMISLLIIISSGTSIVLWEYMLIAMLVVFLSFGAPNQPGSILIGTIIIINYLNVPRLIPVAIYCEVLLGIVQNLVNVVGDIVMVSIESAKNQKKTKEQKNVS